MRQQKESKKILPPEIPLVQHTHDTASTAVACYMAGIAGGVDGIDLAVRPLASGTSQPDVRSMAHSLKGTGFSLDIDPSKMDEIESLLNKSLSEYEFNPVTTSADARVVGFPMPGGAIGPNVHMMKSAGILDKYSDVLAEFPEVVRAGGGWTSVTPGSQQYWLQAFNNVLHGRWEKIDAGYGKSVLGYFGRPPLPPDPEVVKIASEKLELPPFDGDPLEEAPDTLTEAENALKERGIEITDENKFLVAAAIVPGKNMELNEGIRLLEKRSKITLPLKKEESGNQKTNSITTPTKTSVTVTEGNNTRTYEVVIEPPASSKSPTTPNQTATTPSNGGQTKDIFSPFEGNVEVVEVNVKAGDVVTQGQVVAAVEAMKAKHDVKAPCAGRVTAVHASIGNEVSAGKPIMTIEA
jgi:pyruvate carboxylase subunit B